MAACSTAAALLSVASLGCTVPYFIGLHADSSPYQDFSFSLRILILGLLACNTLVSWVAANYASPKMCVLAWICVAVGCAGGTYNLLFGVRSASIAACQGVVGRGCLEEEQSCAVTGTVRAWMGALYLFGQAVSLVSHSYMLLLLTLRFKLYAHRSPRVLATTEEKQATEITGNAFSFAEPAPRLVVTSESVGTAPEQPKTPWTRK